jgi:arylsulfatase A-like enzyme
MNAMSDYSLSVMSRILGLLTTGQNNHTIFERMTQIPNHKIACATMVAVIATLLFLPPTGLQAADAPQTKPNILFIVADDLGYGEPGCYGGKDIPTPHIDALAAGGARFTSGYITAPMCAASRAALMTARYQTRFGFEFNPTGEKNMEPGIGLPVGEKTIADRLRDAGYATGLVGKWHLGGTAPFHPQRRGFDEFFGFLHEGHYFVPPPWKGVTTWLRRKTLPDGSQGRWASPDGRIIWSTHLGYHEPDYDADNPILRGSQHTDEPANLTDAFARESCDFIARHKSQPWFLYLAYNAPHSPLQGADAYMEKFSHIEDIQRRIFAAMVAHMDDSLGTVMTALRESGQEENTLVFFVSDNGGPTAELTSSNAPLRGGKGELLEGGIRVPFIVSWKGRINPRVIDAPVISMDATATALELAGVNTKPANLDGRNLMPLLTGSTDAAPHDALYWRVANKNAVRQGDWKLIRERGAWQLYNLAEDIGEANDLASREAKRVAELTSLWSEWNKKQVAPLWR